MNVFFDVDSTVISYYGGLRPHVREAFQKLKEAGHCIYIWSGVGIRWDVVRANKLEEFVSDCFIKPLSDHKNMLHQLGVTAYPDFCVDDYESVIQPFGGITVKPYFYADALDKEILRVLDAILNHN